MYDIVKSNNLNIKKRMAEARHFMQSYAIKGVIVVKGNENNSLWVRCPDCGGKTRTKVYGDTVLINFPLYCPKCKKENRIDVVNLRMVLSK